MSQEEKKQHSRRRTEAFRKRVSCARAPPPPSRERAAALQRIEEERLLSMPIGQISEEALGRAQRAVARYAERAKAARIRYHQKTPEERRAKNKRRPAPKCKQEPKNEVF